MSHCCFRIVALLFVGLAGAWAQTDRVSFAAAVPSGQDPFSSGSFQWTASAPLVRIVAEQLPPSPDNPWFAVKDPSIVRFEGRWHLFCTLRKRRGGDGKPPGYIRVGYLSFADWPDAKDARWHLLDLSMDYHGAPQVFFFQPQKKWYLIYQLADPERGISFGPCYSTTETIEDPTSWSAPRPFYERKPEQVPGWLDFWVICDATRAHLFFTPLNGTMWRAETKLADFPNGFGLPQMVLRGDVFEASHTYRLRGQDRYLTLIEAQGRGEIRGRRYYKAYLADALDGEWKELAATQPKPFAGSVNVRMPEPHWTDSISHGELLRWGYDQRLEVDPVNLRFLFQGVTDEKWGKGYGGLAWELGMLTSVGSLRAPDRRP